MTDRSLFRRRDPFWEVDGPAARRAHRTRRARGALAFLAAVVAVGATAVAWSIELGVAAALGVHLALPAF
jgi:uncharacterized membrane protein